MRSSFPCDRNRELSRSFIPVLCLCLLITGISSPAYASVKMLMFNPLRVIFADRQRSVSVHVINQSQEPITYAVELATRRKDKNGKLYIPEVETEQEKMIKSMIRFSPRRATIAPGTRQVVKLMVRKPKDLPPGEYHTRLSFTPKPSGPSEDKKNFEMEFVVSSTIPVIIQHGEPPAEVTPLAVSIKDYPKAPSGIGADVTFLRNGNLSAFGNVFLHYIPTGSSSNSREIGRLLTVALYQPENERTVTVPLTDITRKELTTGAIRVNFQPSTGVKKRRAKKAKGRSKTFQLN